MENLSAFILLIVLPLIFIGFLSILLFTIYFIVLYVYRFLNFVYDEGYMLYLIIFLVWIIITLILFYTNYSGFIYLSITSRLMILFINIILAFFLPLRNPNILIILTFVIYLILLFVFKIFNLL